MALLPPCQYTTVILFSRKEEGQRAGRSVTLRARAASPARKAHSGGSSCRVVANIAAPAPAAETGPAIEQHGRLHVRVPRHFERLPRPARLPHDRDVRPIHLAEIVAALACVLLGRPFDAVAL